MKVLAADGRFQDVSRHRAHPAAGLDYPRRISSGFDVISLSRLPTGERQTATYYAIYRSNPWLYAAVNLVAWGVSRMPLKLYELVDAEGNREQIRGDVPATPGRLTAGQNLDRVLRQPEPRYGRMHVFRRVLTDQLICGNSLMVKEADGSGSLRWLHQVPWRKVDVQEGETERIAFYELRGWRKRARYIPEDVVHLSIGNDPEEPISLSPIQPLKYTIALFNAMQRHLTSFFENQARPSGHVGLEKGTDPKILELIREQIKQLYTAPESAGKVLVTTGKWDTMSESPEHSAIVDLVKLSREEVASAYGVPPPLIGILDRAIMGNVRELRVHHMRDVIGPWAALNEETLNAQLISDSPALANHFLEYDLGETLRPDFEARAKALRDFQATYSLNERRKIENLPKIDHPDADAVFLPLNETPIGEKGDGEPEPPEDSGNGTRKKSYVRIGPA